MSALRRLEQLREQARDQVRVATLGAAVAQQTARLQQQVRASSLERKMDPDIADLADHFCIDEQLARSLDAAMHSRTDTFEQDFLTVWEHLEKAKEPADLLVNLIRDLVNGTFVAKSRKHKDIVNLCEAYKLDHMATRNLIEAMGIRERAGENIGRDLEHLEVHLAHSNAPSKLISMKLKEIRGGCSIGAVWHCCGTPGKSKSGKGKEKGGRQREESPPLDGGIGIEGVRGQGSKKANYLKSYSDHDLEQRDDELNRKFGKSAGGSSRQPQMMSEKEALSFQHNMRNDTIRREEKEKRRRDDSREKKRRDDSRSPSRQARPAKRRDDRRGERDDRRDERDERDEGQYRERSRSRGRRGANRQRGSDRQR